MGLFNKLKKFSEGFGKASKQLTKANVLRGTMAICIKIAAADGSIDDDEITKTKQAARHDATLKNFPESDVNSAISEFSGNYGVGKTVGDMACETAIKLLLDEDEDTRKMCVAIGCSVAGADGNFDKDETAVLVKVCDLLGVNKSDFGL